MFKISPIQDINLQKKFAKECGSTYKEGYFAYGMIDDQNGEIMGFSQFEISDNFGYISDLRPLVGTSDNEAMFILGRATMNFIDLCGIHMAKADENTADKKLLHAIGFRLNDKNEYFCDMTGMFDGHCDGK